MEENEKKWLSIFRYNSKNVDEFFVKLDKDTNFIRTFYNTTEARSIMDDIYQMMGVEY